MNDQPHHIKIGVVILVILGVVIGLGLVSFATVNMSQGLTRQSLRDAERLNDAVLANHEVIAAKQLLVIAYQEKIMAANDRLIKTLEADLRLSQTNNKEILKVQKTLADILTKMKCEVPDDQIR